MPLGEGGFPEKGGEKGALPLEKALF